MSTPTAQSGWYPDPMGRYEYRYHNGLVWTADVAMGGNRFVDPAGSPSTPPQPGSHVPMMTTKPKRGMAVAAFVVGLLCVLFGWIPLVAVLAAIGVVIALTLGIIALRRSSQQGGHGRGFAIAGIALAVVAVPVCVLGFVLTGTVVREFSDFLNPGDYEVGRITCTEGNGFVIAEGSITNLSSEPRDYTIQIAFDGTESSTEFLTVQDVAPGESRDFASEGLHQATRCSYRQVFGPLPFDMDVKALNGAN